MNLIVESINHYKFRCGSCDHIYQTALIDGFRKLLHAKVDPNQMENPSLPTATCKLLYDFVRFHPCNHCCPEVFADCPESHTGKTGKPTKDPCSG
jgi:hypothetical protein